MAILSSDEAKTILEKIVAFSKADGCEARLSNATTSNIRYARNSVSTAGKNTDMSVSVQSYFGKKSGTSTINELDDASLEKVVRRSEELAQLAPINPEFMEPVTPQQYGESKTYFSSIESFGPDKKAEAANNSMVLASKQDVSAAGFMRDSASADAIMNSKGLYAYNKTSGVNFTVTMRSNDGSGSGWATRDYNDVSKLDTSEASAIAIDKAVQSRQARAIEPGKYTVILEPAAVAEMLQNMISAMSARNADEGRSFLTKKGGGNKVGEKIMDERISIYSDPFNSESPASPWAQDGLPNKKIDLIKDGVVSNMLYDRFWAAKKNVAPVPFPANVIMAGGNASLDDMIRDTKKGILVTRFWYVRSVDPQTQLYTGLTRDGTFFIENGK